MALCSVLVGKLTYSFFGFQLNTQFFFQSLRKSENRRAPTVLTRVAYFYFMFFPSSPLPRNNNRHSGPRTVIGPFSKSGPSREGLAMPSSLDTCSFALLLTGWCQRTFWDSCMGFMKRGKGGLLASLVLALSLPLN